MDIPMYKDDGPSLLELRAEVVARGDIIIYNLHHGCLTHRISAMAALLVVEWVEGDLLHAMATGQISGE